MCTMMLLTLGGPGVSARLRCVGDSLQKNWGREEGVGAG